MKKKSVYSVSQVNSYVAGLLGEDFLLTNLTVSGEVSNVKYHSSGHIYFTLKDERSSLAAVMFAGDRHGLSFQMKDGDKVRATGRIGVYEARGAYQLYAKQIEPDGEGELFRRFEELKRELLEMGMFDAMYKKEIPAFARTVGIVTAPTGAAVRDIIRISKRRNPYVRLILCPAQVQGEGAAESIADAISRLDALGECDVLIVGRGGGSIEDLWAFNEREVADAIFRCDTPVISAVGHETDTTIADFVADLRASTPSAAAELAVFEWEMVEERLSEYEDAFREEMELRLRAAREAVLRYRRTLGLVSPRSRLMEQKRTLGEDLRRLRGAMERGVERRRLAVERYAARLDGLSPLKRMAAGYAYLTDGAGNAIRSVEEVEIGAEIEVAVADGRIAADVRQIAKAVPLAEIL